MAKLITKGFTTYFSDVAGTGGGRPAPTCVDILSYDGDKYATVRLPSGKVDVVKKGYLCADAAMSRPIAAINWHILAGGKREDYRPRVRSSRHVVRLSRDRHPGKLPSFKNKADAVAYAVRAAQQFGEEIQVWLDKHTKRGFSSGLQFVVCYPSGHAVQYNMEGSRRRRGWLSGNYMRGYGKRFVGRHG